MSNSVRFYDSNGFDGSGYSGRWSVHIDAFTPPAAGSDTWEFNFFVPDAADASRIFWFWVGTYPDAVPIETFSDGFDFDTDSPPAWWNYTGGFRGNDSDYFFSTAGDLGSAPSLWVYNGSSWTAAYATDADDVTVDPLSAADWWLPPATPPPDPPTITAPVDGSTVSYSIVTDVSLEWDPPAGGGTVTGYEVRLNTGTPVSATSPHVWTFTWPTGGVRTFSVRSVGPGGTSDWVSVSVTLDPEAVSTVDCFEDEALADSPDLLWLFREDDTQSWTEDLSGNSHDGVIASAFLRDLTFGHPYSPFSVTGWNYIIKTLSTGAISTPAGVTLIDSATDAGGTTVGVYFVPNGTSVGSLISYINQIMYVDPRFEVVESGTATATGGASITTPAVGDWPQYGVQLVALTDTTSETSDGFGRRSGFRNDGSFPVASSDPDWVHMENQASGTSMTFSNTADGDIALVSVLLGMPAPHLGGTSNICDADCADVNGAAELLPTDDAPMTASGIFSLPWAADFYDATDAWTYEWVESTDACWNFHVAVNDPSAPTGYTTRIHVNGRMTAHTSSTNAMPSVALGGSEVSVVAVYPSALSPARVAAHFSHFCDICRTGRGLVLGSMTLN